MSDLGDAMDRLLRNPEAAPGVAAFTTPKGWEPRVEHDDEKGQGTTPLRPSSETPPSHEEILAEFGLDPKAWEVLTLRKSRWQVASSDDEPRWLEAFRATFRARPANDPLLVKADIDELLADVRSWRPRPGKYTGANPGRPKASFVVALSDFQLGKGEAGGSRATVDRVVAATESALSRLKMLQEHYDISEVALIGLGDIVEQCTGFYAMQTYQADLTMREQRRLAWRLVTKIALSFSPLAESVLLTGIAGNHGETRNGDGKAYTTFDDNDDLLVLDAVGDIVKAMNLEKIRVEHPAEPLAHMVELSGTKVGFVHGHQFTRGRSAGEKAREWWNGQMMGMQPVSDANILLNGHLHHLSITEHSKNGRTTIQAPSMDGGSYWFTSSSGSSAPPGMLTMLVGSDLGPRQWDELRVL